MAKGKVRDPIELLLRRTDAARLLAFFKSVSERMSAAFANAAKTVPAELGDGPAISARGNLRRLHLDRAFRAAAVEAGYPVVTGVTSPPTWNYPTIRVGAFSLTLGIVHRTTSAGSRRLRSRGNYAFDHVARNEPINPQGSLLPSTPDVIEVIPDGSLGAFVVAEPSVYVPDSPLSASWCRRQIFAAPIFDALLNGSSVYCRNAWRQSAGRCARRSSVNSLSSKSSPSAHRASERLTPGRSALAAV